jgi:hypothetical protein
MEGYIVSAFDWSTATTALHNFGGEPATLYIEKTGLPFYDALRLYGAIDLYIGLREDVTIEDTGIRWKVAGRRRPKFMDGRDVAFLNRIKEQFGRRKNPNSEEYCKKMYSYLVNAKSFRDEKPFPADKAFVKLDSTLQAGIRGISAANYETLQTGQTSKKECKAMIPLSEGLLAFAGKKRTENVSRIYFLPVFEGRIDLSKVVSPLRMRGSPNVLCTQALMLLALKTSLFAEGYQDRLTSVVYNTDFGSRNAFNFSGIIKISSTAIGKIRSPDLVSHAYRTFGGLVSSAWSQGKTNDLTSAAMGMAYWLMQPVSKHLSSMITAQERLYKDKGAKSTLFYIQNKNYANHVKEIFEMTYGNWTGDHEAVRKLARAVASGIYWARGSDKHDDYKEQRKNWYDEATMLRSAPSAKTFIERVMILIEQGHREHGQIGTAHRDEDFDPKALLDSIGTNRSEFETFRDLFRMYLVQESTYKKVDSETTTDTISKHKED